MRVTPTRLRRVMNIWPPFLFTGIRVRHIGADWRSARVVLRKRPWNRNFVNTQFGGSLFAMTDPFWMLLIMHAIGNDYFVWDKAATIEFVKPGRGDVFAEFHLTDADVQSLVDEAASGGKVLRWFDTDVVDGSGEVIACVRKQIYVRRKPHKTATT
ncbi:MAG: DUF4442 domain-containing protein [Proteobacteria bacterium]|nr:DUF4442 domain-containing protein [Pseudomonadota bacterium]